MQKNEYLLIIILALVATRLYAVTKNDSLATDTLKKVALKEVVVKAERAHIVKKKGDVVTFFFSHHANEAKDIYTALTEIPTLHIDPAMKTIRLAKGGCPLVLVDGIPKENSLESLSPESVNKVEVSNHVPLEYIGQGYTGVVNIITKRKQNGSTYLNIGLLSHPTMAFSSADANFSYDKGKCSIYSAVNGFAFLANKSKTSDGYTVSDKRQLTTSDRSNYYRDLKAMVGGDYRWTDKTVSSLGMVFETVPQNTFDNGSVEYDTKNDVPNEELYNYHRKYNDDLYKYQLNFFHKTAFSNASSLAIHLSGVYSYNTNTTTRTEAETRYDYSIRYRQKELEGGMAFSFPWIAANWKVGANSIFSWHDIRSVDTSRSKYNERNNYCYIDFEKAVGNLSTSASLGLNMAYRRMGGEHFSFVNWHPIVDLSYHLGSHHTIELSYEYENSNPDITQLCNVNSATNPLFTSLGSKDIKPAYTHDLLLDYTANIKPFYFDLSAQYKGTKQRIAQCSMMDGQQIVMTYYNDTHRYNLYNCNATVRYMIPHVVLLGMIQQKWVRCASYSDQFLYGMLQAQYYNNKLNVNLMLDTNDITISTPENRYKSSPESQLTIAYSISKNVEVSVGMRYLFTHKQIWNTVQTELIQEIYNNHFSTRHNLVMLGIRYNIHGHDKENQSSQVFQSNKAKSFIKDF